MIRIDTHVAVWLYAGDLDRFSVTAKHALDEEQISASPLVQLELTYLHEIGRLSVGGAEIFGDLSERIGLRISQQPTSAVVASASPLSWTRDPFDRMIVGDALSENLRLLTKDELIRKNVPTAFW